MGHIVLLVKTLHCIASSLQFTKFLANFLLSYIPQMLFCILCIIESVDSIGRDGTMVHP